MQYLKRAIYGPDPKEQKRKCDTLIRRNRRELDKQSSDLLSREVKTKQMIKQCVKRNDVKSARLLAREIYKARVHREKLEKSKAQLNSIQMQVHEAFAVKQLQGSMKNSTKLMKEVNQLTHIPELMSTMQTLGAELVKSGIIDDMVSDLLDPLADMEDMSDVAAEEHVESILNEVLETGPKASTAERAEVVAAAPAEEESEDEEAIRGMQERLRALQS